MTSIFRTFGFFVFAFSIVSVSAAAPKKATPDFGSEEVNEDYAEAHPVMKRVLELHEKEFPGAMNYPDLFYHRSIEELSAIYQGLSQDLIASPGYLEAWQKREAMADFDITLTDDLKKESLKLNDDKFDEFLNNLTIQFRSLAQSAGLKPGVQYTRDELTTTLTTYLAKSLDSPASARNLVAYLLMHSKIRWAPPTAKHSLSDLDSKLKGIYTGALDYLEDEHYFGPLLNEIVSKPPYTRGLLPTLKQKLSQMADEIKDFVHESEFETLTAGEVVRIKEVHPCFSMFRGYVGNDCSTSFSPGFVLTPFDRYYYAFDKSGQRLGYVGLSVVEVKNKPAILIHTIQGPEFTYFQAEMVMRGFAAASKEIFGTDQVLMAKDENIMANVNFRPIESAMLDAVSGVDFTPMKWHDRQWRKIIADWSSTMTYDDPDNNKAGRLLPYADKKVTVEIKRRPFQFNVVEPQMSTTECQDLLTKPSGSSSFINWMSDKTGW